MKNIGQRIRFTKDVEVEKCFGTKDIIKKDSIAWVGADGLIHHKNSMIQSFADKEEIKGYSVEGLADFIWLYIRNHTCIDENLLEDYDETSGNIKEAIMNALEELGFYDNTGNRS